MKRITNSAIVQTFTRYEKILADLGAEDAACAAAVARGAIAVYFEDQQVIRDVAAGVAGPLLYSYVRWVMEQSVQTGSRRLYFVARDGEILLKIARACPPAGSCNEFRYLYGSRASWYLAGANPTDLASQSWLTDHATSLTPELFLDRLGLLPTDLPNWPDSGIKANKRLGPIGLMRILQLISEPTVTSRIAQAATASRALVRRYLAQEGLFDGTPCGIVDLGWTGRSFSALARMATEDDTQILNFFAFGLLRVAPIEFPCAAWLFDTSRLLDVPIYRIAAALETFCLSPTGHVTGYSKSDSGDIRPTINYESNPAAQLWGVKTLQDTVVAFANAASHCGLDVVPLRKDIALSLLDAFWCKPSQAEAVVWGRCPYEDDQQAQMPARLATPLRTAETVREVFARRDPWTSKCWPAGARTLTPLPVRLLARLAVRHNDAN